MIEGSPDGRLAEMIAKGTENERKGAKRIIQLRDDFVRRLILEFERLEGKSGYAMNGQARADAAKDIYIKNERKISLIQELGFVFGGGLIGAFLQEIVRASQEQQNVSILVALAGCMGLLLTLLAHNKR